MKWKQERKLLQHGFRAMHHQPSVPGLVSGDKQQIALNPEP